MAAQHTPRVSPVLWSRRAVDLCRVATCLCFG
ncbi:MAG TPA: putative leader peptide [Mycobacteriales bacterium]|nr:putative leader peptide [Mycobacteriales bacterium]